MKFGSDLSNVRPRVDGGWDNVTQSHQDQRRHLPAAGMMGCDPAECSLRMEKGRNRYLNSGSFQLLGVWRDRKGTWERERGKKK